MSTINNIMTVTRKFYTVKDNYELIYFIFNGKSNPKN